MVVLNICICLIIFLIGFNVKNSFSDFSKKDKYFLNQLLIFHFLIAIIFHFYIYFNGGDAIYYWSNTKTSSFSEIIDLFQVGSATGAMHFINYLPAKILNLSFFTGNMLYALIGYLGFIYLYRILKPIITEKNSALSERDNVYVFEVDRKSTKVEVKSAVEKFFQVKVKDVRTSVCRGRSKRTKTGQSQVKYWKKDMVKLAPGEKISLFEGA